MQKIIAFILVALFFSHPVQADLMNEARSRLSHLRGRSSQSGLIGIEVARGTLLNLLNEIELALKESKVNGTEHDTKMYVTKKLVDFTNQTEPANVFDLDEIAAIEEIDAIADSVRRRIFGGDL